MADILNRIIDSSLNNIKGISFFELPEYKSGLIPRKIINAFKVKNNILGDLFVKSDKIDGTNGYIKNEIVNGLGKQFANEILKIDNENLDMIGFNIVTEPEYRRKNFRFGEILRLASVIEMLENKSKSIKIVSKNNAIYFHAKYKFIPNFKDFKVRDDFLSDISKDKSYSFKDLRFEAFHFIKIIKDYKQNSEKQREITKQVNNLVERYINRALKEHDPQKNHPLSYPMDMILQKDSVIKNKDFYNALFEKHSIDYKIK